MGKLAIVLLSDLSEPVKGEMALCLAVAPHRGQRLQDLRSLLDAGITTPACLFNGRQLGQEVPLREAEITMQGIGPELTDLVARGYQVMTF